MHAKVGPSRASSDALELGVASSRRRIRHVSSLTCTREGAVNFNSEPPAERYLGRGADPCL
jgi:hypothetical protein